MTRSELIADIAADYPHLRVADVELIVAARSQRPWRVATAHMGRNPRTGEAVPAHQKTVPFFKAGNTLRSRLNRVGTKHRS